MSTRVRNPVQTRAQIVEAAIETAHDIGVEFTLDAVVSRLPLSKGAVLHHFPSKVALLEAVIDETGARFAEQVRAVAAADADPHLALSRAYLRVTVEQLDAPEEHTLTKAALVACLICPELAKRWQTQVNDVIETNPNDPVASDDALLMRLVADGLWLNDLLRPTPISPDQRRALFYLLARS